MMTLLFLGFIGFHGWAVIDDLAETEQANTLEYVAKNCNETDQRIVVEGEIRTVYQCDRPDYLDVR